MIDKVPECRADKASMEEEVCVICLQNVLEETAAGEKREQIEVKYLSCNQRVKNYYHKECLFQWLKTKVVCPICKDKDIMATHIMLNDLPLNPE
jgi:E3 ubiquitin-protein ligase DOA10